MELDLHSPTTSLWCGVQLSTGYIFMASYFIKHKDNFTYSVLPFVLSLLIYYLNVLT